MNEQEVWTSEPLKPCGCGGSASFEVVEVDPSIPIEHQPNFGGHFIACRKCGMSTVLVFNTKGDDPRPILREKWNASMRTRAPSTDFERMRTALHDRESEALKACAEADELRAQLDALKDAARWHIAVDGLNGSACWSAREFVDVRKRLIELVGPLITHDDAIARIRAGLVGTQGASPR